MCEWGRNTPGFAEISTKGRDGGWVKQADCLESNKTRRLRGPGSSFGTFDWFQRIGMGPSCRASLKLLIVGSPSPKISVYSKHISLRSWLWSKRIFVEVDRVRAALTYEVSVCHWGQNERNVLTFIQTTEIPHHFLFQTAVKLLELLKMHHMFFVNKSVLD